MVWRVKGGEVPGAGSAAAGPSVAGIVLLGLDVAVANVQSGLQTFSFILQYSNHWEDDKKSRK